MELKRIIGPDVKTALRLVREQLGPDAMILSNRRVEGGVEIVAAPEGAPVAPAPEPPARQQAHGAEPEPEPAPAPAPASDTVPAAVPLRVDPSPQLLEVRSELRSMRSFLELRLAELQSERAAFGPGVEGRIWRRLTRIGLPNALVRELVCAVDAERGWSAGWRATLARLSAGLAEAGDVVSTGGVWAFAGPTGAGKTTTICKLAVRHVLAHGARGLALVSMDAARLGGADMLRAVARLLEVPFHAANAGETLQEMLRRVRESELVLVDTAGVNRKFRGGSTQLEALGALRDRVGTLLVLPANVQQSYLDAALADYEACAPVAAIVTKLDETASLGEIIGALTRERLPVAYSTDGQEIPDDLRVASGMELVAHAVMLDPDGESTLEETHAALAGDCAGPRAAAPDATRIA